MDAKYIKVNCSIPDLCSVLAALGQLIVDNSGQGSALFILNRNAP